MSPKLVRISGKEMCGILERKGFKLKRVKGSHHFYVKSDIPAYVTVAVHGNEILKPKTLKSIIIQAKLNPKDFIK